MEVIHTLSCTPSLPIFSAKTLGKGNSADPNCPIFGNQKNNLQHDGMVELGKTLRTSLNSRIFFLELETLSHRKILAAKMEMVKVKPTVSHWFSHWFPHGCGLWNQAPKRWKSLWLLHQLAARILGKCKQETPLTGDRCKQVSIIYYVLHWCKKASINKEPTLTSFTHLSVLGDKPFLAWKNLRFARERRHHLWAQSSSSLASSSSPSSSSSPPRNYTRV